jgi:alanyl-tRNA synthetase
LILIPRIYQLVSDFDSCKGKILAIRKGGQFVDSLATGEEGALILDQTCFYAEQGGQIYDIGVLSKVDEEVSSPLFAI